MDIERFRLKLKKENYRSYGSVIFVDHFKVKYGSKIYNKRFYSSLGYRKPINVYLEYLKM